MHECFLAFLVTTWEGLIKHFRYVWNNHLRKKRHVSFPTLWKHHFLLIKFVLWQFYTYWLIFWLLSPLFLPLPTLTSRLMSLFLQSSSVLFYTQLSLTRARPQCRTTCWTLVGSPVNSQVKTMILSSSVYIGSKVSSLPGGVRTLGSILCWPSTDSHNRCGFSIKMSVSCQRTATHSPSLGHPFLVFFHLPVPHCSLDLRGGNKYAV